MHLIYGKPIAERVICEAKEMVEKAGIRPGLAVVMIGLDPASEIYVGLKEKAAEEIGIHFEKHILPEAIETKDVQALIQELNLRSDIHGIIVQLPLPPSLDTDAIIATIDPKKDADGFHPETVDQFLAGAVNVPPVFPRAILALLQSTPASLSGKRGIVFANSMLFARVVEKMIAPFGVTIENSVTLGEEQALNQLSSFDIVISAKGNPNFLKGSMVKPGAIVIDGGITRVEGVVVSDADRPTFEKIDGFITPVPGGVGPLTVAFLMSRVIELALAKNTESIL